MFLMNTKREVMWLSPFRRCVRGVVRSYERSAASACTYEGELAQRTLVALKPDTLQRALLGEIVQRFERRGLKLCALKMLQPSRTLVERHYAEHRGKPFYERACVFLASGPVVASVWEGRGAIDLVRNMVGTTEPLDSAPGTIRGDYGVHWRRNLIHASDSTEAAQREIDLWFLSHEIVDWQVQAAPWLYELPESKIRFD
jgi:nucleoside-diphosphate kinase